LQAAQAATQRVFELLHTKPTVVEPVSPVPLAAKNQPIHFAGVSFRYEEKPVLCDIELTVNPGEQVALVGASGSGKTTLTNLLLRFYDPELGGIKIGGTDIRSVALAELRRNIAVVTQETILFNESVRSNIACGRPAAPQAEVEHAAKQAFAHEFICQMPQGYDTVVGEKGVMLSGGQRQRLSIARAILKDAPILILDEATNALDTESERIVQGALEELMKGRTTFVIAHRLSTVQNATVIVVMDQGRIVERGTHAELLAKDGVYRKLHELQFRA
jgi:subfamily B ATP-binding cassette protein MsbA